MHTQTTYRIAFEFELVLRNAAEFEFEIPDFFQQKCRLALTLRGCCRSLITLTNCHGQFGTQVRFRHGMRRIFARGAAGLFQCTENVLKETKNSVSDVKVATAKARGA